MPNPNLKQLGFSQVHNTQEIYRTLLQAMSRPGLVCEISEHMNGIDIPAGTSKPAAAIALTLLDGEVSFTLLMPGHEEWIETIRRLTYCKLVNISAADYIFTEGIESLSLITLIQSQVKIGTLASPEKSATIFIRVQDFITTNTSVQAQACSLIMTGPGIETQTICYITGLSLEWIDSRASLIEEYPLGVDIVLYTEQGKLIAIPRTTIVEGVAAAWHM